jgi:hypothetical protein
MGIDPVSLAIMSTVASAGGAVFSTIAQRNAASYEQKVAQRNAVIAEDNARRAVMESQEEQQDWSRAAREQIGQMVAEMGASGVAVDSGTNLLVRRATQEDVVRDAQRIRTEGKTRGDAFRTRGSDFQAQASAAGARKSNTTISGAFDLGSSLISGATRVNRARALKAAGES